MACHSMFTSASSNTQKKDLSGLIISFPSISSWALLKPEELERTLASWRKTIDEGKADEFIQSCEEHRMRVGSSTSIVGYK